MMDENSRSLLDVRDLVVSFPGRTRRDETTVIHGVSFSVEQGETLSLVGESGSGKTTIGRAILGLAPISSGDVFFDGICISHLSRKARRHIAAEIQVVFQDPYTSLNPAMRVGDILLEPLRAAGIVGADKRIRELLDAVGMPSDSQTRYAREFSGGQRQRIAIARALALQPRLIICDEPTSALDVTTQAKVLELLQTIQKETGVSYLFISHDLSVVNAVSDRVAVLKRGQIVEIGDVKTIAHHPQNSYTKRLQMAAPIADPRKQALRRQRRRAFLLEEQNHDMEVV
ncbi:dipeptide/oligopeptide/nickel ABC transporter ATP-binding protein [Schaalia sp. ZJ1691]|uniref:ABC transporter ATP-binding protein n=1 Tax=Schaalia sp. ZJ1691 TaxID=2709404 RepID=UPI001F14C076|nr:dipeptide/oligopeptide/nickel ABC transporter ATP-binding protein [Schaalia sp. ZJ1691]